MEHTQAKTLAVFEEPLDRLTVQALSVSMFSVAGRFTVAFSAFKEKSNPTSIRPIYKETSQLLRGITVRCSLSTTNGRSCRTVLVLCGQNSPRGGARSLDTVSTTRPSNSSRLNIKTAAVLGSAYSLPPPPSEFFLPPTIYRMADRPSPSHRKGLFVSIQGDKFSQAGISKQLRTALHVFPYRLDIAAISPAAPDLHLDSIRMVC